MEKLPTFFLQLADKLPRFKEKRSVEAAREVAESFQVAQGSQTAHELYVRAWSLHKRIPAKVGYILFSMQARRVQDQNMLDIIHHMAHLHKGNDAARVQTRRQLKEVTDRPREGILGELPGEQFRGELLENLISNSGFSSIQVDRALKEAWVENTAVRLENLKFIACALDLYYDLAWWHNLKTQKPEEAQSLIDQGKSLLHAF